ncbi:isochorismatase hydrolase [Thermacetogenium phaeum DSM 12270]|uniref:Isochorismatase hydrolase n=1 Tax=Thermacetogenium phaeum (strain ATCC BAA-254 / DSM 26808 / PB) TaxID=1089553 RepID=K4LG76_THEPS|nr:isochorismatase family cysteine hydrolase [Thermacetogenium phaeum]AFV12021.1 isochorismatase hydrolase [Thermacetogenium phaeum DSM 12270]
MGGKALIVVDMLNDFVVEGGALYVGEAGRRVIPVIARALEKARSHKIPVIYICDRHLPGDREFEMFPTHCVAGTWGGEVCAELAPREGDVIIPKRRYSGFYGTDLDLALRELGAEDLVLVGVCTNICVLYTAADARMRNYKVSVLKDGVASFDEKAHEFALREMEKTLGVQLLLVDEWEAGNADSCC